MTRISNGLLTFTVTNAVKPGVPQRCFRFELVGD